MIIRLSYLHCEQRKTIACSRLILPMKHN